MTDKNKNKASKKKPKRSTNKSTSRKESKSTSDKSEKSSSSMLDSVVSTFSRVTNSIRFLSSSNVQDDTTRDESSKNVKKRQKTNVQKGSKKDTTQRKQAKVLHPLNIKSNQAHVYSAIAFFIHCREHNKILLSKGNGKWFPFVQEVPNHCWTSSAREALPLILTNHSSSLVNFPLSKIQFLEILRFQPPERLAFFTRVLFYIPIQNIDSNNSICCKDTAQCQWFTLEDVLTNKVSTIWGPEVFDWCLHVYQTCQEASTSGSEPIFTHRVFEFTYDNIIRLFKPYKPSIGQISVVPPGSRCTSQDANRIFSDFLRHCYPAFGMTQDSFREYFLKYKLISFECRSKNNRINRYFNAFNFTKSNNLSFEELLLGLCEIDYDKKHNNTRIAFIFRFYDKENKGYLNEENFLEICRDMNRYLAKEKKAIHADEIPEYAAAQMKKFSLTKFENEVGISQTSFVEGVGKHVFRGTSNLCRSYNDIFQAINRGITQKSVQTQNFRPVVLKHIIKKTARGICKTCWRKKYKLQTTLVSIRLEPISAQATTYLFNHAENERYVRLIKYEITTMQFTKDAIDKQNVENIAFWIMKQMREFNRIKFNVPGFMCSDPERQRLVQILQIFAKVLEPIFKSEKRCKPCSAPSYIIGDIHGNIEDLLSLETTIWPRFPTQQVNYVFLGDYVDRGKWSVECALYLISMKIISPNHVTLLRGNHEVRDIQCRYTYKLECLEKYSSKWGKEIFELTNKLFDMLPLSAIVDDSMFCCHGGLPECIDTIEEINRESNEIAYPEMDSLVAWQIMWADPIKDDLFNELYAENPPGGVSVKEGFLFNRKRGTAHWFNETAFRNFAQTNGITHMARAHEVPRYGFELMFDNRLVTIFSCSHYCKNENDCGVLLLSQEKIRVIRIDTTNNAPAMDF